ncbi:MAG: bifunctional folylpolyglutamate synthase/dihydrofolate synthase [Oligoflexia bacterium]|nr:bifunctional folylpolyglutamate synthase/dihydrofolate synthase [Oligoflexia bacterium]
MSTGIEFLNSLAPWRGEGGFSLSNISKVLNFLGNPQDMVRTIHVAGTNGKGSVSATTAAILGAAGHSVGLFTSPHLTRVEERIVINGLPIATEQLERQMTVIRAAVEQTQTELSYFEAITAAGFLSFHDANLDWAVIEVGLGGRLDATNVLLQPVVTAISSIDFDHEAVLGNTIEQIAFEKAGILKEGVPVVIGPMPAHSLAVVRAQAELKKCETYHFGEHFHAASAADGKVVLNLANSLTVLVQPSLRGAHQRINSAIAAQICALARVNHIAITDGISEVFWPARLEEGSFMGRDYLMDAAHNPAGIKALTSYLQQTGRESVVLAFGALRSKNWQEMMQLLLPFTREIYLLCPHSDSAVTVDELQRELSGSGITIHAFGSDHEAFIQHAFASEQKGEILITGSIYLLGSLREKIGLTNRCLWTKH